MSTNLDYQRRPPFTDVGYDEVGFQLNLYRRNRFNTGNIYSHDLLFKTLDALVDYYNGLPTKPPYAIAHNLSNSRIVKEF